MDKEEMIKKLEEDEQLIQQIAIVTDEVGKFMIEKFEDKIPAFSVSIGTICFLLISVYQKVTPDKYDSLFENFLQFSVWADEIAKKYIEEDRKND